MDGMLKSAVVMPGSSDYLSVSDLSHRPPQPSPFQQILDKIDSSVINCAYPGLYQQGTRHDLSHARHALVFEQSLFAFRELMLQQLWQKTGNSNSNTRTLSKRPYENAADFCRRQWNIDTRRANTLLECAALLLELAPFPVRPKTEAVCHALLRASDALQPSPLQRQPLAPALWTKLLEAWQAQQQQQHQALEAGATATTIIATPAKTLGVEYMSEEFIHDVLIKPHLVLRYQQQLEQKQKEQELLKHQQQQQQQQQPQRSITPAPTLPHSQDTRANGANTGHPASQGSTTTTGPPASPPSTPNAVLQHHHVPTTTPTITTSVGAIQFQDIAELVQNDGRRFHPPRVIVERVHQFFHGPPQLDPAGYEDSWMKCPVSIPFPEILDAQGPWSIVEPVTGTQAAVASCFLHVPLLPSKRRFESDDEVVVLDDTRLARIMNERLWEEFSKGNVKEAITLVPLSSTWFQTNKLADWPCVVMPAFKFEQANGRDPSGKKYYEFHNYMVVYLGHDHLRQVQFVETFQDLGVSPLMRSDGSEGHHRWIAGYRRLMRPSTPSNGQGSSTIATASQSAPRVESLSTTTSSSSTATLPGTNSQAHSQSKGEHDDNDTSWIDPRADDIYSALPPYKKPRLERVGRPSDARAAWHHSKRRKTDVQTFSKLADQDIQETPFGKEDGHMSE